MLLMLELLLLVREMIGGNGRVTNISQAVMIENKKDFKILLEFTNLSLLQESVTRHFLIISRGD